MFRWSSSKTTTWVKMLCFLLLFWHLFVAQRQQRVRLRTFWIPNILHRWKSRRFTSQDCNATTRWSSGTTVIIFKGYPSTLHPFNPGQDSLMENKRVNVIFICCRCWTSNQRVTYRLLMATGLNSRKNLRDVKTPECSEETVGPRPELGVLAAPLLQDGGLLTAGGWWWKALELRRVNQLLWGCGRGGWSPISHSIFWLVYYFQRSQQRVRVTWSEWRCSWWIKWVLMDGTGVSLCLLLSSLPRRSAPSPSVSSSKIRAVCFAPASACNDVLFLAKSLPAISYTARTISSHPPGPHSMLCLFSPLPPYLLSLSPLWLKRVFFLSTRYGCQRRFESQAKGGRRSRGAEELWVTPSAHGLHPKLDYTPDWTTPQTGLPGLVLDWLTVLVTLVLRAHTHRTILTFSFFFSSAALDLNI